MTGDWGGKLDKRSIKEEKPPNLDVELRRKFNAC